MSSAKDGECFADSAQPRRYRLATLMDDNETKFSEIWRRSQRCAVPAVDGATGVCSQARAQPADEVYPAGAVARRGNRGSHPQRSQPIFLHADRNRATAPSSFATNAILCLR